jgi:hypothetical protein
LVRAVSWSGEKAVDSISSEGVGVRDPVDGVVDHLGLDVGC